MNPFRIGLYGCGSRTRQILSSALVRGTAEVTLCYDIDSAKAEALAQACHAKVCSSLNELLNNETTDMYLISLFPAAHPDALLAAVKSEKPIYIEKPVAVISKDITRLTPLIGKYYIHIGLFYHYIPVFRELTRLVRSGKIGKLVSINFNWLCNHYTPGLEKDSNWRYSPATGGELTQHYCHCFDWFRSLNGNFESITAMCGKQPDNQSFIEDVWDLIIRQKSGCQISFHSSERNPKYSTHGYLEGTDGSLEWEWNTPSHITYYKGIHQRADGEELPIPDSPDALEDFIARFRNSQPPAVTLEDGLWSVLPPILARESVRTGQIQIFPERLDQLEKSL